MIKQAFSLIELIFAIIIIGIMAQVGSSTFKPRTLDNDVEFIVAKIKETQFLGIGYEHYSFKDDKYDDGGSSVVGCIDLTPNSLSESATDKNTTVSYKIKSTIDGVNGVSSLLCFDSKGRPHEDSFELSTLYSEKKSFTIEYRGKKKIITIEPITGYVIISK